MHNSLHQHDLKDTEWFLLLCYITDILQQILEKQSVHPLVHVIWVRMSPDQKCRVFCCARIRPEGMWRHGGDLVWVGFIGSFRGMDGVDEIISCRRSHLATENSDGLGLDEM
jgi:hypothetical protein